ncbi:MAG TPA: archease [Longimicrobiales bacterium]|nr:archease [Longimicrobiales bacterium]
MSRSPGEPAPGEPESAGWPEGTTGLDHTADVGLVVRAPSLADLFRRAAAGMMALIGGSEERSPSGGRRAAPVPRASRRLELDAPDLEALLVAWLREILFAVQSDDVAYTGADFDVLCDTRLAARVAVGPAPQAVRELKGVTYHALTVRREGDGWLARVVFDV